MTQTEASRKSSIRFHLLNGVLALAAALLGMQSLLARSVSAGWDLGLLLPLLLAAALLGLLMALLLKLRGQPLPDGGRIPFGACLCAAAFPIWLFASATAWA